MRRGTQWNLATPAMRAASVLMVGLTCADAATPIRVFPAPRSIAPVCAPVALDGGAAIPVVVAENPADAIQAGIDVLGISLVTNLAAGISATALSHEEVIEAGRDAGPRISALLAQIVGRL